MKSAYTALIISSSRLMLAWTIRFQIKPLAFGKKDRSARNLGQGKNNQLLGRSTGAGWTHPTRDFVNGANPAPAFSANQALRLETSILTPRPIVEDTAARCM